MHSTFWRDAQRAFAKFGHYGMWQGCGPGGRAWEGPEEGYEGGFGGGLGVRRPLRFLVHKLGLLRVQSADRLRAAVLKALQQIHAILNPDQRVRLAYLIRTGRLAI
jgi:hypothetical protein